jgi:beta-aspartyl-peptidase (threonine type)
MPEAVVEEYTLALERALSLGQNALERGAEAIEVVVEVVRVLEDAPLFNAGKGSVFNQAGDHELEASLMDGRRRRCGAVAGLTSVKNPIVLAKLVMKKADCITLFGGGAEHFAEQFGIQLVGADYFFTKKRYAEWADVFSEGTEESEAEGEDGQPKETGTVGCVVRDKHGNVAAATSSGGKTNKLTGRQGDTSVIGAGTFACNRSCAVSCTGTGEPFMRHVVARDVAARMEYAGQTIQEAVDYMVEKVLMPGDGGIIAVSRDGDVAMAFNSEGMFRGAANSEGLFEVKIR